jgi:hypothetical protein
MFRSIRVDHTNCLQVDIKTLSLSHKTLYKSISANRHTNADETFRAEGIDEKIVTKVSQAWGCLHDGLRHIKHSLVRCPFGKDGGLRNVDLQSIICLEDGLELIQNLQGHVQFSFYVPIISVCYRSRLLELS